MFPKLFTKETDSQTFVGDTEVIKGKLDTNSSTWIFIRKWAREELEQLRKNNDNSSIDERKTAILRGEIKRLKILLDLDKENTM